jgi:translation initiation factor 5B
MVKLAHVKLSGISLSFRSSYIIAIVFTLITAAVLAEICSALPLSGSIYIWAAEAAGPKYSRFFGFVVAWWSCMSWITYAAGNCQVCPSMADQKRKKSF